MFLRTRSNSFSFPSTDAALSHFCPGQVRKPPGDLPSAQLRCARPRDDDQVDVPDQLPPVSPEPVADATLETIPIDRPRRDLPAHRDPQPAPGRLGRARAVCPARQASRSGRRQDHDQLALGASTSGAQDTLEVATLEQPMGRPEPLSGGSSGSFALGGSSVDRRVRPARVNGHPCSRLVGHASRRPISRRSGRRSACGPSRAVH